MSDVANINNLYLESILRKPTILTEQITPDYQSGDDFSKLTEWYQYDLDCIDEIIQEGFFKNVLTSVGNLFKKKPEAPQQQPTAQQPEQSASQEQPQEQPEEKKGMLDSIKKFATDKLITGFLTMLLKKMPDNQKNEFAKKLGGLAKNPEQAKQLAAQGQTALEEGGEEVKQESYVYSYSNKDFIIQTVFKESDIHEYFNSLLLTEAAKKPTAKPTAKKPAATKTKKPTTSTIKPKPQSPEELAKMVASSLAGNSRGRDAKLKSFKDFFEKEIQATGKFKDTAAEATPPPLPETGKPTETGSPTETEKPETGKPAEAGKQGLFRRALNWARKHPEITASAAIGIVAAITVATGGTAALPILGLKMLSGAATGAGVDAVRQKTSGEEGKSFDWVQTAKSALRGAATAATLGLGGQALGAVGSMIGAVGDGHGGGGHGHGSGAEHSSSAHHRGGIDEPSHTDNHKGSSTIHKSTTVSPGFGEDDEGGEPMEMAGKDNINKEYRQAVKMGLVKNGQNVTAIANHLVDSNGKVLLPDPTGSHQKIVDAAKQMRDSMR